MPRTWCFACGAVASRDTACSGCGFGVCSLECAFVLNYDRYTRYHKCAVWRLARSDAYRKRAAHGMALADSLFR